MNIQQKDIVYKVTRPFLAIGYVFVLIFGLAYYSIYFLVIKLTKKQNYYGNIQKFIQGLKAMVFSNRIKEDTDRYRQKAKVRKSRMQSAEYIERPRSRIYAQSITQKDNDNIDQPQAKKSYFFKRLFAYAKIFFLNEEIRKEKAKEIDQKYPPKKAEYNKNEREYSKAKTAAKKNNYALSKSQSSIQTIQTEKQPDFKRAVIHKRILIGSAATIVACAVIFVGALAYAQELPASMNIISPNPTANLFQTTVPVAEPSACEILPDTEEDLLLENIDNVQEEQSEAENTVEAAGEKNALQQQDNMVSGSITTQPKIYKQGDEDPEVAKIQQRLMDLRYMSSSDVTNYYGKNTTYAMEYFQRQHGLQVDGTTGAETLAILYSNEAQEYKMEEGTEGSDVKEMQQRLYDLKYLSSSSYVTGYFGSKTKSAVKDFQDTNGLSADGIVGYYTLKKLNSSSAIKNSTSSSSGGSSGGSGGSTGSEGATGSGSAADIVTVAKSLKDQGYIYVWGGKNPSSGGFDCSGFVYYVVNRAGIKMGYKDTTAWATTTSYTTIEDMKDVKPGDVLVFSSGHVGIYIGDGKMIHSTRKGDGDLGGIYIDNFFTSYRESVWVWGKRLAD